MRLPNGYGSIYKLKGKRRRPYAAMVTTGWTDEGKPIRKYLGYYEKRQGALDALAEYNDNPYSLDDSNITLADLWEKYGKYRDSRNKEIPSNYKAAFKRMAPYYPMRFRDITAKHIQDAVDDTNDHPPLARLIRVVMVNLYKYANFIKLSNSNYAKSVEVPELQRSTLHHPFTDNEIKELWSHESEIPVQIALMLCYTGMRPTELGQIRTENVHLDERYMIGGIKTKAGKNRRIPINEKIVPIIKKWYSQDNEFLLVLNGKHIQDARMLRYEWIKSTLPALTNHTPHDGRHNCETRLDNAHVNKRIIQLIIGHAGDVDSVYTAKTTKQLVEAINLI